MQKSDWLKQVGMACEKLPTYYDIHKLLFLMQAKQTLVNLEIHQEIEIDPIYTSKFLPTLSKVTK